jgi:hypothetical protein
LLGRFTQPDTLVLGADNPQNFNRYTYVLNNPVCYTDPTGHMLTGTNVTHLHQRQHLPTH